MKAFILTLLVLCAAMFAHAQGTIWFKNFAFPVLDAPVFLSDGVTKVGGYSFQVELLVGPSLASLARIATTGFFVGNAAGYFDGGTYSVPTVQLGEFGWVEVRVFNQTLGSTFEQAQASPNANAWGASAPFQLQLGGGTLSPPVPLFGLTSFSLNSIPEPCTLPLVGLGTAVFFRRITKNAKCLTRRL